MKTEEKNHAIENATCWLETIVELAEQLSKAVDEDEDSKREEIERDIRESALSVSVRSDWTLPGEKFEAAQYCILLSTGGPALRMIGFLNQHGEPEDARLEWQDWGVPWTEHRIDSDEEKACLIFARQFYFGG